MSKAFTKDDVIQNKKESIKNLNSFLESLINSTEDNHLKKAHLMSYWLKDYVQMVRFEEKFDPARNLAYKRGNIVKAQFGFNVGSEFGGLHYGVVIDTKNDHNSPVVTVIPLTSIKDNNQHVHKNSVDLGSDLYRLLKLKHDTISKKRKEEQEDIQKTLLILKDFLRLADESTLKAKQCDVLSDEYDEQLSVAQNYLNTAIKLKNEWDQKKLHNQKQLKYLDNIASEISTMKKGSIALVNQITTISKIRIVDPRNMGGVLSNISLSPESMEKINIKMKELYGF